MRRTCTAVIRGESLDYRYGIPAFHKPVNKVENSMLNYSRQYKQPQRLPVRLPSLQTESRGEACSNSLGFEEHMGKFLDFYHIFSKFP